MTTDSNYLSYGKWKRIVPKVLDPKILASGIISVMSALEFAGRIGIMLERKYDFRENTG